MAIDFTPDMKEYTGQGKFRYWVQMVLPTIYDDSLSYMELLNKVVYVVNLAIEDVDAVEDNVAALLEAFQNLQQYTNDYFDNLDVQEEINNKLDEMAESGELSEILDPVIIQSVSNWLQQHITPTSPAIDNTLSVGGAGADSLVTGQQTLYPIARNMDISILAEINTSDKTLSFPANMNITSPTKYSNNNAAQVINYGEVADNIYAIIFDFTTKTFSLSSLNDKPKITSNYGLIGLIRKTNNALYDEGGFFRGEFLGDKKLIDLRRTLYQMESKWSIYLGAMFLCLCGDTLVLDMYNLRLYDKVNNVYTRQTNFLETLKINFVYSGVRYINLLYDAESQVFTLESSSTPTENTIAMHTPTQTNIYTRLKPWVVDKHFKINHKPLVSFPHYLRSDSDAYLNFERLYNIDTNDFGFALNSTDYRYSKHLYRFKNSGTRIYNDKDVFFLVDYRANNADITNKKILMIGDSFIARGWIQNYLKTFVPTLEFIGTKQTQYYDFMSEGISGSSVIDFTNDTSPFYFNGTLNFAQYLSTNNLSAPDFVVINTCINGSQNAITYQTEMQKLIDMIHAYNSNIKVYVTIGANYENSYGIKASEPNRRIQLVKTRQLATFSLTDCVLIPVDEILSHEDYPTTNLNYNDDSGKIITVITDPVHPLENVGFNKIAKQIYNYLGV